MASNIDHARFPGCTVSDLGVSAPVPHCLGWHTWNVALQTTPKLVSILSIFSETEDTARAYFSRHEPNVQVLAVEMVLPEGFVDEPQFNAGLASDRVDIVGSGLDLSEVRAATEADIARTRTTRFWDIVNADRFTLKPGTRVIAVPFKPDLLDRPDAEFLELAYAADDLVVGRWYWIEGSDGAWYVCQATEVTLTDEIRVD